MLERGGEQYFDVPGALAFLDDCERDGKRILSMEGFPIGPSYTTPLTDEIHVFAPHDPDSVAAARRSLVDAQARHAHQPDCMVAFVIDE